ncbi:MAG: hypothetical protein AAGC92_09070 [Pseudomonadota bacterium]
MSTPIFERFGRFGILSAACLAVLAGCATDPDALAVQALEGERAVVTAGGRTIDIVPPDGYCILNDAVETGDQAISALVARCRESNATSPDGLLTASVSHAPLFRPGAPVAGELDSLEAFLDSERGRPLLTRNATASAPEIVETYRFDDMLVMLIDDPDSAAAPVSTPRYWRAFMQLNQRMVTVSASAFAGGDVDDRAVLALLRAFTDALRTANARPSLVLPAAG